MDVLPFSGELLIALCQSEKGVRPVLESEEGEDVVETG